MAVEKTVNGKAVLIGRPSKKSPQGNLVQTEFEKLKESVPRENFERLVAVTKSLLAQNEGYLDKFSNKQPVFSHDEMALLANGVHLRPAWRIPYEELRRASYTNSLIGAIHRIRVDDLSHFFQISTKQGFSFSLNEEDKKLDEETKLLVKNASEFFRLMGDKTEGWSKRDKLHTVGEMMIRDTLCIDSVCFWLIKNPWGKLIEIRYLDPATIFPVLSDGYIGDKSIGWVQMIDGQVKETFGHDEIIWKHQNHTSDVAMRGHGMSPTEAAMMELITIIYVLKKNRDRQSNRTPPEGFLSINKAIGQDAMDSLTAQWRNIFTGGLNNYAIPILAAEDADIKYQSLNLGSDMVFDKLLEWATGLVCAAHGIDPMEVGLKLRDSGALSEASSDGRVKNTMSRAKKALLGFFSDCFNDIKEHIPEYATIKQVFTGIDKEDEKEKLDKDEKLLKAYMTVDEVRRRNDLPLLEEELTNTYKLDAEQIKGIGGIILDSTFSQFASQKLTPPPEDDGMGMDGEEGMDEEEESEEEDFDPDQDIEEEEPEDDDEDLKFT